MMDRVSQVYCEVIRRIQPYVEASPFFLCGSFFLNGSGAGQQMLKLSGDCSTCWLASSEQVTMVGEPNRCVCYLRQPV